MKILADHRFADTTLRYLLDPETGAVGLVLFPTASLSEVCEPRANLAGEAFIDQLPGGDEIPARVVDSLVQIKIVGDPYTGGHAQGLTMRQSPSLSRFRYQAQRIVEEARRKIIVTTLESTDGLRLEHRVSQAEGDSAFEVSTIFHNGSDKAVVLEMLSSFSLSGITPFDSEDASDRLHVHRFRSVWCAEARLDSRSIEELHLERSWHGGSEFSERFGQVGSLPVRKWFPFLAIEDREAGIFWGAQLAWAGSWQMEIFRQHDDLCVSGGLADREFGHWKKTVAPGKSLAAPSAAIACARGTLEDLCDRLTDLQNRAADQHPAVEADLPIVFNEWCTTWGKPDHNRLIAIADLLKDSEVKYLVIDAGWYNPGDAETAAPFSHGDWEPSSQLFPHGIEATAAAIRERGLIPGLWFEMEDCGSSSQAFALTDRLLHCDGQPLTTGSHRRFWNLDDPWVIDHLGEKVAGLLRRADFGYLKVDYNATIGIGPDHPDSHGEGLRLQTLGTYRLFDKIRAELPDLVIENCASGGHRLEPSMIGRSAMSSFSDAHELVEIPIVAANLHYLVLPRQLQVWAVLRASDNRQRLVYSLSATFLGRMCLSGDLEKLDDIQWEVVRTALRLYRRAVPVIKHGTSRHYGERGPSWRHPGGWQALRRVSSDGGTALVVLHTFARAPARIQVPLPQGEWRIAAILTEDTSIAILPNGLEWTPPGDFCGTVTLLECRSDRT